MGASNSKPPVRRLSKKETLTKIRSEVNNVRRSIDNGGSEEYYKTLLTRNATAVQGIRNTTKKTQDHDQCKTILNDINQCIRLLEEKEVEVRSGTESRESNLDLGAVESNSFISQDITQLLERKDRGTYDYRIHSLTQIQERTKELDEEIRKYVVQNDLRNLVIVEKKIHILYNDLDQIEASPNSSALAEKRRLAEQLIKFNRKINNVKRKSTEIIFDNNDGGLYSKPSQRDEGVVLKIEHNLSDLEVSAFTFEDVRASNAYVRIEQRLKDYYTKLENVVSTTEEERRRVGNAKSLIKKILASLKQRALENEVVIARDQKAIENIEKTILDCRTQSEYLSGGRESVNFVHLDQKIRNNWDQLNEINCRYDVNVQYKEKVVRQIQELLKDMNKTSRINDEMILIDKLVQRIQDSWDELRKIDGVKEKKGVCRALEEVETSIRKFLGNNERPDLSKLKQNSISSEIMDQLVTEMTTSKKNGEETSRFSKMDSLEDASMKISKLKNEETSRTSKMGTTGQANDTMLPSNIKNEETQMITKTRPVGEASVQIAASKLKNEETSAFFKITSMKDENVEMMISKIKNDRRAKISKMNSMDEPNYSDMSEPKMKNEPRISKMSSIEEDAVIRNANFGMISGGTSIDEINVKKNEDVGKPMNDAKNEGARKMGEDFGLAEDAKVKMHEDYESLMEESKTGNIKMNEDEMLMNEDYVLLMRSKGVTDVKKNEDYGLPISSKYEDYTLPNRPDGSSTTNASKNKDKALKNEDYGLVMRSKEVKKSEEGKRDSLNAAEAIIRIQSIEKDIVNIRRSLRNFSGTTDSEMYDEIEDKLITRKSQLENLETQNKFVNDAKDRTIKQLEDTNITLRNQAELNDIKKENMIRSSVRRSNQDLNRRSIQSVNKLLENIMEVDSNIHNVEKQIQKFTGTTSDKEYEVIVNALIENNNYLESIDCKDYDNLKSSRSEVLQHINDLQVEIATKATDNEMRTQDELSKMREVLQNVKQIKKKIDCFQGTYKNIQYTQLEKDLKISLEKIDTITDVNDKITRAKAQCKETIKKFLKILDERSIKPQTTLKERTFEKIHENLVDIKTRMETFMGTRQDEEYFNIVRDLHICDDDLKSLNEETQDRKITYLQYVQELFRYFETKTDELASSRSRQAKIEERTEELVIEESLADLQKLEEEMDEVLTKINYFQGEKSDVEYCNLDEALIALMIKVDKVNTFRIAAIKERRKLVMQKLNKCSQTLDERCKKADPPKASNSDGVLKDIAEIVAELEVVNEGIRHFEGGRDDQHYLNLDSSLIKLFLRLDGIKPMNDTIVKERKIKAMKEIQRNMRLLEDKVSNTLGNGETYASEETLV